MLTRAFIGAAVAVTVAVLARRTHSLSSTGALAAAIVGTIAAAAGWTWAVLLIVYFASSTWLSRWGHAEKEKATAGVVVKGGDRDAIQVLANGGMFTVAALGTIVRPDAAWLALGVGSLAASAADTWATEIGTQFGGTPRSIISMRPMLAGMSGGVSAAGTFAALLGACFVGCIAWLLGAAPRVCAASAVAGVAGALVDSLLGATVQSRRWCATCERATERPVHDCGSPTGRRGGIAWLNNDAVNFLSSAAGGLLSAWIAR